MGVGTITAKEVFTERVELQPRTSDPSGTEEGEGWIRSDIAPDSNQIATFRVDTGGSTIDVPILQTGTSADGVVEALRLSVGGTVGYVPAIPESKAAFPSLRLQHNGQVYGWHDARGETAFFDVAITATNAPVFDGQTLTVDYSVQNTGGSLANTQDIGLDVGSTERDRDSGVTIASGASTTGQLSWESAAQGSYTASVVSDDDSASTSVSVESAIPDSVVHRYEFEGDATDSVGSLDGTVNGATFSSTEPLQGSQSIVSDGDDNVSFESNVAVDATNNGIAFDFLAIFDSVSSGDGIFSIDDQNTEWVLEFTANGELGFQFRSNASNGFASVSGLSTDIEYRVVCQYDASTGDVGIGLGDSLDNTGSGGSLNEARGNNTFLSRATAGNASGTFDDLRIHDQPIL